MRRRWLPQASPILAAALLVLLAALALLQYRWIGEVSRAERERLQTTLASAARRFAADADLEITRAFAAFRLDPRLPPDRREEELRERWRQWRERAAHPRLILDLLLVRHDAAEGFVLRRLADPDAAFEPADWPADLARLRARLEQGPRRPRDGALPAPPPPPGDVPSLLVPLGGGVPPDLAVVRFERAYLAGTLLPELVERHFAGPEGLDYDVVVVRRGAPEDVIYRSDESLTAADLEPPDATAALFDVRPFAELRSAWRAPRRGGRGAWRPTERDRPREPPRGAAPHEIAPAPHGRTHEARGAWRLLVRHRAGSLEAVVARARARNLALSLGVLSLLALSVGLLAASARRAQRLARQQIEFVAGVTHELHTPLAGIRSAAQNLQDGVVSDPAQVRRYGGMIEKEGRRLSEMLEQVLEFAGIHTGRRLRKTQVDLAALVGEVLASCRFLVEEARATVETEVSRDLPPLEADPEALRAALRNVIANAVKYGGGWLRVTAAPAPGRGVEVRVEDRGPGIAEADRPHIFEPFYRGAEALARGTPGSGLGLGIVKEVIEAHGGSVWVRERAEGGSCFTLRLPAAPAQAAPDAAEATP